MKRRGVPLLFLAALAPGLAGAYDASFMVGATPGSLPQNLTVPHDGDEPLGMMASRAKGVSVRDEHTRDTAERVARALQERTGRRPYLVIAKFDRKYLDANRPESEAMESADALPAYRAYHDRVATYVAEVKTKFPDGALLVDIHGQGAETNTVFRGTRAGLTMKKLVDRFGPKALQGSDSIMGLLAAKGYSVNPALDAESMAEDPRYRGGYTVFNYGSHKPGGIDAIQLELGSKQRASERFSEDLAEALVSFMKSYGLMPKDEPRTRGPS